MGGGVLFELAVADETSARKGFDLTNKTNVSFDRTRKARLRFRAPDWHHNNETATSRLEHGVCVAASTLFVSRRWHESARPAHRPLQRHRRRPDVNDEHPTGKQIGKNRRETPSEFPVGAVTGRLIDTSTDSD